jgi:hypothetical protein
MCQIVETLLLCVTIISLFSIARRSSMKLEQLIFHCLAFARRTGISLKQLIVFAAVLVVVVATVIVFLFHTQVVALINMTPSFECFAHGG